MKPAMRTLYFLWAISPTIGSLAGAYIVASRWARKGSQFAFAPLRLVGALLVFVGLALRIWATWEFWIKGHGTPLPPLEPTRLVNTGPYCYSRNPLYLGKLTIVAGFGLVSGSPKLLLSTLIWWALLHWLLVPWEESTLQKQFGAQYIRYQEQAPRWMSRESFSQLLPKTLSIRKYACVESKC